MKANKTNRNACSHHVFQHPQPAIMQSISKAILKKMQTVFINDYLFCQK